MAYSSRMAASADHNVKCIFTYCDCLNITYVLCAFSVEMLRQTWLRSLYKAILFDRFVVSAQGFFPIKYEIQQQRYFSYPMLGAFCWKPSKIHRVRISMVKNVSKIGKKNIFFCPRNSLNRLCFEIRLFCIPTTRIRNKVAIYWDKVLK